jgi:hypothetical protein
METYSIFSAFNAKRYFKNKTLYLVLIMERWNLKQFPSVKNAGDKLGLIYYYGMIIL